MPSRCGFLRNVSGNCISSNYTILDDHLVQHLLDERCLSQKLPCMVVWFLPLSSYRQIFGVLRIHFHLHGIPTVHVKEMEGGDKVLIEY